ncbi:MAG: GntR family transcriptional regulator [Phycisphaeraceae bacterium]|nr:GntR family transcriptional regulator [Phycisphaeraceae bacterium]
MSRIRSVNKQQWLADQIRRQVIDQKLVHGHRLPTDNELIQRYRVSRITVVQAMKKLVDEGFISREVGRGTFVQDRTRGGQMAVVLSRELMSTESSPYFRMTAAMLMQEIAGSERRWRGQMHLATLTHVRGEGPRELDILDQPDLLSSVRGVFTFHFMYERGSELEQHGIPWVTLGYSLSDPCVYFDHTDLLRQAMRHLAGVGCRTVGSLWQNIALIDTKFWLNTMSSAAARAGLDCPPECNFYQDNVIITERGGWELFHKFWKLPRKPDALFVRDEILARGVFRAALELGVRFPQDIRLIIGATHGVDVPHHQRVTRLESNPEMQVKEAMRMMDQLVSRQEPPSLQVALPYQFVPGDTA